MTNAEQYKRTLEAIAAVQDRPGDFWPHQVAFVAGLAALLDKGQARLALGDGALKTVEAIHKRIEALEADIINPLGSGPEDIAPRAA